MRKRKDSEKKDKKKMRELVKWICGMKGDEDKAYMVGHKENVFFFLFMKSSHIPARRKEEKMKGFDEVE